MEPHRFCGFEAQTEGGFTIPTIYRRNDELRLNYRCQPGGWVSVELMQLMPSMFHGDVDPLQKVREVHERETSVLLPRLRALWS